MSPLLQQIGSRINSVKYDLAIAAQMNGCYPVDFNPALRQYFPEEDIANLDDATHARLDTRDSRNICDLLHAPPTIWVVFCPMEAAYLDFRKTGSMDMGGVSAGFHALNGRENQAGRIFELFRFFARPIDEQHVLFRFLPFPSTMDLHLSNAGSLQWCFDPLTDPCRLPPLPAAVRVDVCGLGYNRTIRYDDLPTEAQEKLRLIRRFLNRLLLGLEKPGCSPVMAWQQAVALPEFANFNAEKEIPDPVVGQFVRSPEMDSGKVASQLVDGCRNGLDGAVLSMVAFKDILEKLHAGHRDRLQRDYFDTFEDRVRYCRLHLTLDELLAQDRYVGWLPMEKAYRDERTSVLDELYGNFFATVPDDTAQPR